MLRIVQFVHILEKWSQELDENFGKDKILDQSFCLTSRPDRKANPTFSLKIWNPITHLSKHFQRLNSGYYIHWYSYSLVEKVFKR